VAYDRLTLKNILETYNVSKCIGVWPGKLETDCFILLPEYYKKITPPEDHRDIDSAQNIEVYYNGNKFQYLTYIFEDKNIKSQDENLLKYMQSVGLRYKVTQISG
jgi:hypothetical protein